MVRMSRFLIILLALVGSTCAIEVPKQTSSGPFEFEEITTLYEDSTIETITEASVVTSIEMEKLRRELRNDIFADLRKYFNDNPLDVCNCTVIEEGFGRSWKNDFVGPAGPPGPPGPRGERGFPGVDAAEIEDDRGVPHPHADYTPKPGIHEFPLQKGERGIPRAQVIPRWQGVPARPSLFGVKGESVASGYQGTSGPLRRPQLLKVNYYHGRTNRVGWLENTPSGNWTFKIIG